MQLVGTDEVFRLLRDLSFGVRRQKFRRDRRIEHVIERRRARLISSGVREVPDKVPDQGLRNTGVDTVHRHMVAVVGRPAERELRKVARTDDEAVRFIGKVHEDLGAFPGLRVFIGDVVVVLIVADVGEMLPHRVPDRDLAKLRPRTFRQHAGVAVRPVGGPEARHRDAENAAPRQAEHIEGLDRNKERQRGVKTAGKPDDRAFSANMLHALPKAHRLDRQDLLAAARSVIFLLRDERELRKRARKGRIRLLEIERHLAVVIRVLLFPGGVAAALGGDPSTSISV